MFNYLALLNPKTSLKVIKIGTSIFMLLGIFMAFKVWTLNHLFPVLKVFEKLPAISNNITVAALLILILLLVVSLFWQHSSIYWGILALTMLLLSQDYMRWQPWIYMYGLMFVSFLFDKKSSADKTLFLLRIILSATYFWAGFHKLNPYFINTAPLDLSNDLIRFFQIEHPWLLYKLRYFGYLIPLIEIGIALGLWTVNYRKLAVFAALITHLIILIFQAQGGVHYFGVVYPWNLFMMFLVWILFYQPSKMPTIQKIKKSKLTLLIILLVWVLPILNGFGLWHNYASFKLYTGNDIYLFAIVNEGDLNRYFPHLKKQTFEPAPELVNAFQIQPNEHVVSFYHWTIDELSLPLNLNKASLAQLQNYIHTFDSKFSEPIRFLIYKNGRYQTLSKKQSY